MKKVLHVTISSEIGGGPEHILQLIIGLSDFYEMHVACPSQGLYFQKFLTHINSRTTNLKHRSFNLTSFISLIYYIKKNKIDLIHGHGKGAGVYCRLLRLFISTPVIHTPHGFGGKRKIDFKNRIYLCFEKFFSRFIDAVIYVSKTESELAYTLNVWQLVHCVVINNGTIEVSDNLKYGWRNFTRNELQWDKKKVIVTASRFDYQKNTIEFCKIASLMPEMHFVILGDGSECKYCKDYCSTYSIKNVEFLGNVTDSLRYFASADLYLSTARWEGLSMAILEAMSCGLPIVASRVIGNVDILQNADFGYMYELGDLQQARKNILNCFDNENYQILSRNSKKIHALKYSAAAMCDSTRQLYYDVIQKRLK